MLASMHAAFSVGMLAAAALAAVAPDLSALGWVGVAGLALTGAAGRSLAPDEAAPGGPAFARPSRALAALGAIAFAGLLCEGAIADWSAVHLRDTLDASRAVAPLGLTAFALAMTLGRLFGDRLAPKASEPGQIPGGDAFGLVRAGAAVAAAGLIAAALAPSSLIAVVGFSAAGLGLSIIFPTMIRRAGDAPSIAAVSSSGYVGLVTGPPLIGAVAEAVSLRAALAVILGSLTAAIVVLAR